MLAEQKSAYQLVQGFGFVQGREQGVAEGMEDISRSHNRRLAQRTPWILQCLHHDQQYILPMYQKGKLGHLSFKDIRVQFLSNIVDSFAPTSYAICLLQCFTIC